MATTLPLRHLLTVAFTLVNGVTLYLFLLQLPFGPEAFIQSIEYWSQLSPRIGVVMGIAVGVTAVALVLRAGLSETWKNSLLYFKREHPHPAHQAFFGSKDSGLDLEPLNRAYPRVRDSAWDPAVQVDVWKSLFRKHATARVVSGAQSSWSLLRDLYTLSLVFLLAFLVAWPLNSGVVFAFAAPYLFVFGGQTIFLCLSARSVGWRLVVNVLGTELGMEPAQKNKKHKSN